MAKRTAKKLPEALSQDELRRLLERPNVTTTTGLRDRAMLEVMARAGLRVSELVALRPEDITWSTPGDVGLIHVKDGKGGKDRNVPISDLAERWMRAWAKARSGRAECFFHTCSGRSGGAVTSKRGSQLNPRTVWAAVKRYAAAAQLPAWVSPHRLRNTFATWQIGEGTPTVVLASMMGHEHVETTEIYTRVGTPETKEAMRRINARNAEQRSLDGLPSAQAVAAGQRLERIAERLGVSLDSYLAALEAEA